MTKEKAKRMIKLYKDLLIQNTADQFNIKYYKEKLKFWKDKLKEVEG